MKTLATLSLLALSATAFAGLSSASERSDTETLMIKTSIDETPANSLTVAELFTSQSCSSCPPAEALFSELAEREDLLTIEWHVDYWDSLVHRGSRWKDVYSKKEFTARQRSYNRSIRGTNGVYTPQAVVNGELEGVGNREGAVSNLLRSAPALSIPIQINQNLVTIGPDQTGNDVLFLRLLEKHETDVKGGENKGRKLAGKNIVLAAEVLGKTGSKTTQFEIPDVGEGETCAVIIQDLSGDVGPVHGAAKCE